MSIMRVLFPDIRNFNVLFDSAVPWDHERMVGSTLPIPVGPDHIRTSGYTVYSTADGQYRLSLQVTPSVLTRLTIRAEMLLYSFSFYFELILHADHADVWVKYNEILGQRRLASVDLDTLPELVTNTCKSS